MGKRHPVGYYNDEWLVAHHGAFDNWTDFLNAYLDSYPGDRNAVRAHCKRSLGLEYKNRFETYNDDWILEHWDTEKNWNRLTDRYNAKFGTNLTYGALKSYCNRKMGLNFKYTKAEDDWLRENFPKIGKNEIGEKFNQHFGTKRSSAGVYVRCKKLGLKVNEERRTAWKNRIAEVRKQPVGHIAEREHGTLYVKTESGWKRLKELVIGTQKGNLIVHLDGKKWNLDKENLEVVDRQISAIMTAEKFWSENREVTKAGIQWARLKLLLNTQGVEVEQIDYAD